MVLHAHGLAYGQHLGTFWLEVLRRAKLLLAAVHVRTAARSKGQAVQHYSLQVRRTRGLRPMARC